MKAAVSLLLLCLAALAGRSLAADLCPDGYMQCMTCANKASLADCFTQGTMKECPQPDPHCQMLLKYDDAGALTKVFAQCVEGRACDNVQNNVGDLETASGKTTMVICTEDPQVMKCKGAPTK